MFCEQLDIWNGKHCASQFCCHSKRGLCKNRRPNMRHLIFLLLCVFSLFSGIPPCIWHLKRCFCPFVNLHLHAIYERESDVFAQAAAAGSLPACQPGRRRRPACLPAQRLHAQASGPAAVRVRVSPSKIHPKYLIARKSSNCRAQRLQSQISNFLFGLHICLFQ